MKIKRKKIKFSKDRRLRKGEIYSFLVNTGDDGLGLTARTAAHLIGSLERDMRNYSKAEIGEYEDNLGRALLIRLIGEYPELADYLQIPTYTEVVGAFEKHYPDLDHPDIATMIGATKQNSWRWIKTSDSRSLRPLTQVLFKVLVEIEGKYGKEGVDHIVKTARLEHRLNKTKEKMFSLPGAPKK